MPLDIAIGNLAWEDTYDEYCTCGAPYVPDAEHHEARVWLANHRLAILGRTRVSSFEEWVYTLGLPNNPVNEDDPVVQSDLTEAGAQAALAQAADLLPAELGSRSYCWLNERLEGDVWSTSNRDLEGQIGCACLFLAPFLVLAFVALLLGGGFWGIVALVSLVAVALLVYRTIEVCSSWEEWSAGPNRLAHTRHSLHGTQSVSLQDAVIALTCQPVATEPHLRCCWGLEAQKAGTSLSLQGGLQSPDSLYELGRCFAERTGWEVQTPPEFDMNSEVSFGDVYSSCGDPSPKS